MKKIKSKAKLFTLLLILPLFFACNNPSSAKTDSIPPAPTSPEAQCGTCGDGIKAADEECDAGIENGNGTSGCTADCKKIPSNT